ncbi:MAG TPA: hypothetical protein VEV84_04015 [Pyrinomonadaceae bacterium]|nr:hypothetical protein [Pyrinomonadaceae bacterium]
MTELAEWDSFYLIVGGAGGALIGLQFVVMTLIAGRRRLPGMEIGAAFATPTVIHFGAVLLLAALLRAPWKDMGPPATLWGLMGLIGVVYSIIVIRRMRAQTHYKPVFEDWLFHGWLPLIAYAILAISALAVFSYEREALFGVGASVLLLLFIGIHNSWDTVTYNVFVDTSNPDDTATAETADERQK